MILKQNNGRRGQALVEYGLIIAGVVLAAAVGVSLFGHKTAQLVDAVTVVLPAAHADDNGPIVQGQIIETTGSSNGSAISLDLNTISSESGQPRLGQNIANASGNAFDGLIVDPNAGSGS